MFTATDLKVVIEFELVRVGTPLYFSELLVHFVVYPTFDEALGENVTGKEKLIVSIQGFEGLLQGSR